LTKPIASASGNNLYRLSRLSYLAQCMRATGNRSSDRVNPLFMAISEMLLPSETLDPASSLLSKKIGAVFHVFRRQVSARIDFQFHAHTAA